MGEILILYGAAPKFQIPSMFSNKGDGVFSLEWKNSQGFHQPYDFYYYYRPTDRHDLNTSLAYAYEEAWFEFDYNTIPKMRPNNDAWDKEP